jgi:hypothetical protein
MCECYVQRGKLGGVLECNRCWRTRGGRPIRLGNRLRRIPTETSRRIKASCTRVNDPTHQRINSPPCWTDVIPQDPSGEQDLTPDCPWPRNPSPGATHIWQGPSASFFYCPPSWHVSFTLIHVVGPGVTSPETTRSLALGSFFINFYHFIIILYFFAPGLNLTNSRLSLGSVAGRKDPEDCPRIRTA